MLNRRAFLGTLAGTLLATPLAAEGQQAKAAPRVAFLGNGSTSFSVWMSGVWRHGGP
jgi:hypothetical protein